MQSNNEKDSTEEIVSRIQEKAQDATNGARDQLARGVFTPDECEQFIRRINDAVNDGITVGKSPRSFRSFHASQPTAFHPYPRMFLHRPFELPEAKKLLKILAENQLAREESEKLRETLLEVSDRLEEGMARQMAINQILREVAGKLQQILRGKGEHFHARIVKLTTQNQALQEEAGKLRQTLRAEAERFQTETERLQLELMATKARAEAFKVELQNIRQSPAYFLLGRLRGLTNFYRWLCKGFPS